MKAKINFSKAVSLIFFIVLITFLISTIIIGGDALSGKIVDNGYFVWDAIHKTNIHGEKLYLEVSKYTYYFSLSITYVCLLIIPVFLYIRIKEFVLTKKKKKILD